MSAAAEIRKLTITAMAAAGYGHIGGSMSICDTLAVLYTDILNIDPTDCSKRDRDWFVLSKGHCGPALYAALSYRGYFDKELLKTLNSNGTNLPSHCDRLKTAGVDLSTGSLGQGLSLAVGAAMGNRLQRIDSTVFVMVGDGELQEGQNWEAIQFIAHWQLDNIVLLVDYNRRQLDGFTEDICKPFDLREKFTAFGLDAAEVGGHDVSEIYDALLAAKSSKKPSVVILNTEKGHGCYFSETKEFNHYMVISAEMAASAIKDIDARLRDEISA
ncbi:MAG: transketolase [Firmicutes bacterium HGW-Firmicutes-16]|nr:MAG: transketolase [Firmicutes bacterium HGW-Firmicutes-16]